MLGALRILLFVALPQLLPLALELFASGDRFAIVGERFFGHEELGVFGPAVESFRAFDLLFAEGLAVRFGRVLFVRRAVGDMRTHADERRSRIRLGRIERAIERGQIVGVLDRLRVPAVCFVAPADIFAERKRRVAFDRDVIVVVAHDQLAETQMSGQRRGFTRHAFHHVSVAADDVGVMVDDVEAVEVEARGEKRFGDREADRVAAALAERPGRRLDAWRVAVLRVARASSNPTGGTA